MSQTTTDVVLRLVMQGAAQLQQNLANAQNGMNGVGNASNGAAQGANNAAGGLNNAAQGAGALGSASGSASGQVSGLQQNLERLRNGGAILMGVGAAGLALANQLIEARGETDNIDASLESLLKKQGRLEDLASITAEISKTRELGGFAGTDEFATAAVHLARVHVTTKDLNAMLPLLARGARTAGAEIEEMADTLGEAYAGLDLGGLEEMGLFFDEADEKALEAAKSISEAAGQAKFMELFISKADTAFVGLEDSISAGTRAANELDYQTKTALGNMGSGAGEAKAHVDTLLASIIAVCNGAPELEHAAGYFGFWISGAAAVGGGLLSLGSQIGLTIMGLRAMGITGVSSFLSLGASAWTAATGIWAAMAPLIPLILAIAAAALVATAAIYVLSGAQAAIDEANANEAQAQERDREFYDAQVRRRSEGKKSFVNEGESFEGWQKRMGRGGENGAAGSGAGGGDVAGIQAQIDKLKSGDFSSPSAGAAPTSAATIGAPVSMPSAPATGGSGPNSEDYAAQALASMNAAKTPGALAGVVGAATSKAGSARPVVTTSKGAAPGAGGSGAGAMAPLFVPLDGEGVREGGELVIHLIPKTIRVPLPSSLAGLRGKMR